MPIPVTMPYGPKMVDAILPHGNLLGTLEVPAVGVCASPGALLAGALENPSGMQGHGLDGFLPGDRVVIVVSDIFRRTGMEILLPALLEGLGRRGVSPEDIHFLVATGVHRPSTSGEICQILGAEVHARHACRVTVHNAYDRESLSFLGRTSRGTPVWINRMVLPPAKIILTGTVVLHYFAGFGGGRKSLVPGVAGEETISANHSLNLDPVHERLNPAVRIGVTAGNPVAEDMHEAAAMVPVALVVNTVLAPDGGVAGVFAGDRDAAHSDACAAAAGMYVREIGCQADLVVASSGGARNFIQSHKALFNAWQALRPGGVMVFLAPASEGLGTERFREWLSLGSPGEVMRALRTRAEINGQTALSTLGKAPSAVMVTEMTEQDTAATGAEKAPGFQEAVDRAFVRLRASGIDSPSVLLMPHASHTVPELRGVAAKNL